MRPASPGAILFALASIFLVIMPWIPLRREKDAV